MDESRRASGTAAPVRIPVRVIGSLRPGWLRVVIGPGVGMLDGGFETELPAERLPAEARRPNAVVWMTPEALAGED